MSIKIDLKIFLFSIILILTKQIEIYSILMIFAFIHELAHLFAGIVMGYKVETIEVTPFGFCLSFKTKVEDYNKKIEQGNKVSYKRIIIALAGPVVNILISYICLYLKFNSYILQERIIYSNLLLGIFNLLPIYPLDGGRILKELIYIKKGKEKSYEISLILSKITIIVLTIFSSVLILYVRNVAIVFVLIYLWCIVIKNEKIFKMKLNIYNKIYQTK